MHNSLGNVLAFLCVLGVIGLWVVLGWVHSLVGYGNSDNKHTPKPSASMTARR